MGLEGPRANTSPSGTVTFLFTDIEGSTRRWERDPAAMQAALRLHDRIVRGAIEARGGHVFKTIGDAFCAAFATSDAAIHAALDAQRSLAETNFGEVDGLRVRMALNTGPADERDNDYFGPALNRVARLLAIGHGGQVLLSEATATLDGSHAGNPAGAEVSLRDLGRHVLKDLTNPERVYQLIAPGLQRDFPALRSTHLPAHNLPETPSSFVGRAAESAEVIARLRSHRLVTVVGPGGIGKTRLSIHVARDLSESWRDGCRFVDLSAIVDPELVTGTVALALGFQRHPGAEPEAALIAAVGRKHLLIVLDNCEHVLDATANLASAMLRDCPSVSILASSRQPLRIKGESVYRMPGLALPPKRANNAISAQSARESDAVELFVERAEAADSRFSLSDEMAPAIVAICERLDGIPLAIELAAARVHLFGARGLQERLDKRFRLLVRGGRDAAERQSTLRATIDWSYDLLSELERSFFRTCGIFADAFTADAAAAVAVEIAIDEDEAFEKLHALDEQSLIVASAESHPTRFHLLDSMRAYALERLEEHGERGPAGDRHLEYFRDLAERAEASFMSTGSDTAYTTMLEPAVADLRAALGWALSGGNLEAGAELAVAIGRPWSRLGMAAEEIERIEALLVSAKELLPRTRARLLTQLSWLEGSSLHSARAYEAGSEAVRWARVDAEPKTLAWALSYFALAAALLRRFDEAEAALDESRMLAGPDASAGQRLTELEVRAFVAQMSGDLDTAAEAFEQRLVVLEKMGDTYSAANATAGLAEVEHARGNTQRAIGLVQAIVPDLGQLLGREHQATVLANLAGYYLAAGDSAAGWKASDDAIALLIENPSSAFVTVALQHRALALAIDGFLEDAAAVEGYCERLFDEIGYEREATETISQGRLMEILRSRFGDGELAGLLRAGAAMRSDEILKRARYSPAIG